MSAILGNISVVNIPWIRWLKSHPHRWIQQLFPARCFRNRWMMWLRSDADFCAMASERVLISCWNGNAALKAALFTPQINIQNPKCWRGARVVEECHKPTDRDSRAFSGVTIAVAALALFHWRTFDFKENYPRITNTHATPRQVNIRPPV